jgi:hypothetical protein
LRDGAVAVPQARASFARGAGANAREGCQNLGSAPNPSFDTLHGTAVKVFCSVCGSSLFGGHWPEGEEVSIRLGSLDGDPEIKPQYHSFVDSRVPLRLREAAAGTQRVQN